MKKTLIALVITAVLALTVPVNAMTLAWDTYTDSTATGLRIEASTDKANWSTIVDNIPTDKVAAEVPDGADYTRIYYRMKAFNSDDISQPSEVVSFYWSTGGSGQTGLAPVDGIRLLDCDSILQDSNNPNYDTCLNRYIQQ